MKKVLITGVSRGLGKALAEHLSNAGVFVFGTVRNLDSVKNSERIRFIEMNLQNTESINDAVNTIFQEIDTLDAVIHNAGIAYLDPADVMTDEERRTLFDVNFFGPIYLTEKILPHFRRSNKGQLIFISSIVSVDHWPSLGVYSASKAALECVAFEWAVLLKRWNIDVSIIRPNPLPTDMQILRSHNVSLSSYGDKATFCNDLNWEKTEDVCALIYEIINSLNPNFDYTTGELSQSVVDSIIKKGAYQKLLKHYQEKFSV